MDIIPKFPGFVKRSDSKTAFVSIWCGYPFVHEYAPDRTCKSYEEKIDIVASLFATLDDVISIFTQNSILLIQYR